MVFRVINLNNLTFSFPLVPWVLPSEVGIGRILPTGRAQQALSKVLAQLPTTAVLDTIPQILIRTTSEVASGHTVVSSHATAIICQTSCSGIQNQQHLFLVGLTP